MPIATSAIVPIGPSWIAPSAPRESVVAPPAAPIAALAASATGTTSTTPLAAYPARPSMTSAGEAEWRPPGAEWVEIGRAEPAIRASGRRFEDERGSNRAEANARRPYVDLRVAYPTTERGSERRS